VRTSNTTWAAFRERFLEEYASGLRPGTRRNYGTTFDLFERLCGPRTLRGVTERTVSAFAGSLRKLPGQNKGTMQASTIKVHLQALRAALNWAAGLKLIPQAPRFPTVKLSRKRPQPVPAEAAEKLFAKAAGVHPELRAFLLCGWLAGLRLDEALKLERSQTDKAPWVDWQADRIRFPAGFVKGDADQLVPLDPTLRAELEGLPRHGPRLFRFERQDGAGLLARVSVSALVVRTAREAGVRLTMRSLRRGFGCRYAAKAPAQVLQLLMRHASINTTMDYYVNAEQAAIDLVLPPRNSLRNREAGLGRLPEPPADASGSS